MVNDWEQSLTQCKQGHTSSMQRSIVIQVEMMENVQEIKRNYIEKTALPTRTERRKRELTRV